MHNLREWSPWSLTFIYPSIHPSIRLEQVTFGPNSKVSIPTVEEGNVSPRATKRGLKARGWSSRRFSRGSEGQREERRAGMQIADEDDKMGTGMGDAGR